MFKTIRYRRQHKNWQEKYDVLAPKVGDIAPDFELRDVKGNNLVRLSNYICKKPIALIFGSHT